ncbi:hypothetical protein O181_092682 [Austropuccinia psidii MF-1]|uniref:Integrase catalytic domain-containing protein n=1 Tax=Austropuccinia psidii MF-1 TaxID=1389203 RepID=A0A9Q3P9T8_9BASI|nr:hypothetical protein [Austropuccinia psidii MF-1]
MQLSSPPPPGASFQPFSRLSTSAYDCFMQEPYRAADRFGRLQGDGSSFPESRPLVIPSRSTAKEFFHAIKAQCCPGSRFHKLKVVRELLCILVASDANTTNTSIVLSLCCTFAMFKKLGIEADELKGLLAQATCWAPPTLDQLITAAILSKGDEKPSLTFVGQVIINASQRGTEQPREPSPFVYHLSDPPDAPTIYSRPRSPYSSQPSVLSGDVRRPASHIVDRFGASCFHYGRTGPWRADCPFTKGMANPNPRPSSPAPFCPTRPATPDRRSQQGPGTHYHRERVSKVQFVERDASNKVLIDTGASIHLSGSMCFATCIRSISPFRIFFADSNSSVLILQTTTVKLPVNGGSVLVHNVAFSDKISRTILSVGQLCAAGVVPIFNDLKLSLFVGGFVVTTTFNNHCWWLDILAEEGTKRSAAVSPSCTLPNIEMHPISKLTSTSLSLREWHESLGHACDKMVISFLKQHVPTFDAKRWQPFYCEVCATEKSTHRLARAQTDVPKRDPLNLLVSDIMGPFAGDTQGFRYLLMVRDHVSTYSVVYPLKARSDAPDAILDAIRQLQVRLRLTPKALRMDNAKEFTLTSSTSSLAKLGMGFFPSLPYSPQENGKAERLNRTLGDMAQAMMVESQMPDCFWRFAYASACFLHNRLPNSQIHPRTTSCLLSPRGLPCCLLKPLLSGGWLLWDPVGDRQIQLASIVFPRFQSSNNRDASCVKGSISHIVNATTLVQVPTEHYFKNELTAIDTLSVTKDIAIPEHLGQALSGLMRG